MPEFAPTLAARDQAWMDLRERLSAAARDMHFFAFSSDAVNGAAILMISANLARLAMTIPLHPAPTPGGGPVDASTLFATQILQLDPRKAGDAAAANEDR